MYHIQRDNNQNRRSNFPNQRSRPQVDQQNARNLNGRGHYHVLRSTVGSDCYHAECDTLETMIDMMVIDNGTGQQSLVLSFDLISWWIFIAAMHLDETPIYDKN